MSTWEVDITAPVETNTPIEAVRSHLVRRRFPCTLLINDFEEIVTAALRELNRYMPTVRYVSFTTVEGVQDYRIFDAADTTTAGVAAGALSISDVLWNPGGDWTSLNIFSPGWMMLSQMVIFTGSFFHQPSQMMVLRQQLDSWKQQFGSQGHEIIGLVGATDSLLRIFPVPQSNESKVVVELQMGLTMADIIPSIEPYFYQWVEYYAADTLANLYAVTAGVDLLNFADSKEALRYWEGRAKRYYDKAIAIQGGSGGTGVRG